MARRVVVTHEGRLRSKYGKAGLAAVLQAAEELAAADAQRGDECLWAALEAQAGQARAFKEAVDSVCADTKPDDVLILGGPDVVPHQALTNPVGDDGDGKVPSDLPYACAGPWASEAEAFLVPSRSVGRLPDLPGEKDPGRLVAGLEVARTWKPRPRTEYGACFALSAAEWKTSTNLSVQAVFGKAAKVRTSPKEGPAFTAAALRPLVHFINCHGAEADPQFYGQKGDEFPVAHRAALLGGKIAPGTVVAAECCYGAELYDPEGETPGIAPTCLAEGAIGFLGSTTIAYGPADTNGEADLLCRFFVEAVLRGATLGRALLEARIRFVKETAPLSPVGLKTLAQFVLLGDPSLRVVAGRTVRGGASRGKPELRAKEALSSTSFGETAQAGEAGTRLTEEARRSGFVPGGSVRTFPVRGAGQAKSLTRFHLLRAERKVRVRRGASSATIPKHVLFVAREVGGRVVRVECLFAHGGRWRA